MAEGRKEDCATPEILHSTKRQGDNDKGQHALRKRKKKKNGEWERGKRDWLLVQGEIRQVPENTANIFSKDRENPSWNEPKDTLEVYMATQ